jgi:hypothetical protein
MVIDVFDWKPLSLKFFWFDGLLLMVHSELLKDFKAYYRALEEG